MQSISLNFHHAKPVSWVKTFMDRVCFLNGMLFFMYLSQRGTREEENDEHFVFRGKTEAKVIYLVGKEALTMQSPTEFN